MRYDLCAAHIRRSRSSFGTRYKRAVLCLAALGLSLISSAIWQSAARTADEIDPLPTVEVASGLFIAQGVHATADPENQGAIANLAFIVGAEAVAVVDTGGSFRVGQRLRAAIRARTDKPIRYVVNTHMHPDHVLGNAAFLADRPAFVGHHKLARALAARRATYLVANAALIGAAAFAGTEIVPPTLTVTSTLEIDLGGRKLRLTAHSTSHTDNDLTVFDHATDTLILGDLLFVGHIPALDGSLRGWLSVMDAIQAVPASRAVPGHGPATVAWPAALAPQRLYLERLAADVRAAIRSGRTIDEAAETAGSSERRNWELFDEFNARNAMAAFAELEWE